MSTPQDEAAAGQDAAWRLAAIVASSNDAIISKTLNGVIVTWNEGATKVFGYRPEEVIGKSITILIPADRQNEEVDILERIRRGESIQHFETIRQTKDGELIDISLTISPILDETGQVVGASKIARDITARKSVESRLEQALQAAQAEIVRRREAEKAQSLLLEEIKHRVKNTLGIVQAIANQTFAGAAPELRRSFGARLQALAGAHDLLGPQQVDAAPVAAVVAVALAPFREHTRDRFEISGPAGNLGAANAMLLALVLHELATNAVKYGALSDSGGTVTLSWGPHDGERRMLHFVWREEGGPPVTPPQHKGFGSNLIRRALANAQSQPSIDFAATGVVCSFDLEI